MGCNILFCPPLPQKNNSRVCWWSWRVGVCVFWTPPPAWNRACQRALFFYTSCTDNSPTRQESPSFIVFFFLTIKTNLLQQPSITEWCPSPLICPSGWPDSKGRRMPPTESATPASQSCAAPSVQQLNQPCVLQIPSLRLVFGLKKKNGTIWTVRKLCSWRRYLINTSTYCNLLNS